MSETASPFEYASSFAPGEISAAVHLEGLEAQYEALFAEVIEDGVITADERARLERAADALGLDRARLATLERALAAAYEAHRKVRVQEVSAVSETPVPADAAPPELPAGSEPLLARIRALEARVVELEREIEELRAQAAV